MGADGYEERTAAADESARDREMDELLADEDYDGAPWCQYCGAKRARDCGCGEIAGNH